MPEPTDDADVPAGGGEAPRFRVRPVVRPPASPRSEDDERAVSRDETDEGWGDSPSRRDEQWYRRERPPHHG